MNPNERDIVSMTRDVWSDHMRYVKAIEEELSALKELLKQIETVGDLEGVDDEE